MLGARAIVVWTTSYGIDNAFARWRGAHPRIPVTRRVVPLERMHVWLAEAERGERPFPDAVMTDATTIGEWQASGIWRQLNPTLEADRMQVPVGIIQSTDSNGARFAVPLAVNPIGAWYARDLLATVLPDVRPEAVSAAFGSDQAAFFAFLAAATQALPIGPLLSSTLDDFLLPALESALQHDASLTTGWQEALIASARQAESQQYAGADRHYSGTWYQAIKHEHTGLIIAGRWMQSALMRAVGDAPSSWRLTQPAGGFIAGPSLVCAIPERSVQPEAALALANDLSTDIDTQLLISGDTGTVPALHTAHQSAPFVGTDAFCGGQAVGEMWCAAATALNPIPLSAERIEQRRTIRNSILSAFSRA